MVAWKSERKTRRKKKQFHFVPVHFFVCAKGADDGHGHPLTLPTNVEVLQRPPASARPTACSKQNTIVKNHRFNHIILAAGATRDKLDRADKAAMQLWGRGRNHKLVVGDLDWMKVSCFSRKPVEIGWVSAGRSSSSAAAAETDGEPDGCGSPSATDSRRRLMMQFRCKHKTRLE